MKLRDRLSFAGSAVASMIIGLGSVNKRLYGIGKEPQAFNFGEKWGNNLKQRANLDTYRGTVYSCVALISETVGRYEPYIYKKVGDEIKKQSDHEFLRLLENPQPNDPNGLSKFQLFSVTEAFMLLQGEAFWYMANGTTTGKAREITILRPDRVGIAINKDNGDVEGYFIRTSDGQPEIPLELEEVLHFKNFNPKNPYRGYSTIDALTDQIETEDYSVQFTRNFFRNNAGISGVLSIKGEVIGDAFKAFVRQWREKYEGVDAAGKTAIIRESDAEFTKVGLGLDEIDMSALRKISQRDILTGFRVPLALLGVSDEVGLGRATVEALEYIFAKYNIEPKLESIDSTLQNYLSRVYKGQGLLLSHISDIPEDKEFAHTEEKDFVNVIYTVNEVRERKGLGKVPGGDKLYIPLSNFPIDEEGGTIEEKKKANMHKPLKIKITRSVPEGSKKKDKSEAETNNTEVNGERKEQFRLNLMRNQLRYERRYLNQIKPILREQKAEALYNLEAKASALETAKEYNEQLFDDSNADKLLLAALVPVVITLSKDQGALALVFAGDDESEFKMTNQLEASISASTLKMAKNFNDETLIALNKTLAEGVALGEALGALTKRVELVYTKAEGFRATRVARTETLKASNNATNSAYKQTGYVKEQQWYMNPGGCPECEAFDGKTAGLNEDFAKVGESYEDAEGVEHQVTYENIEVPPLHPNCRCTIIPVR